MSMSLRLRLKYEADQASFLRDDQLIYRGYREGDMNSQQRVIAEWMLDVTKRRNISARAWAELAGLGKDTVSRAMRENYDNVTSTRTLALLAEAIGENPPGAAAGVPALDVLEEILQVIVTTVDGVAIAPPQLTAIVRALREVLLHLADDQQAAADRLQGRAIARAVARQQAR